MRHRFWATALHFMLLTLTSQCWADDDYLPVLGGVFRSALPENDGPVTVAPYRLRRTPVSNREFLAFLSRYPQWRRDQVARLYASDGYLAQWRAADQVAEDMLDSPVSAVSWYAARAFCEAEDARLPSWYEWEYAAAADAFRVDARADLAWRAQILRWYERPASRALPPVGRAPNIWGVRDMHGAIYEWVDDFNGLFVSADNRVQGEQKTLETCGSAALSLDDRENYAILMRIAMLAALSARDVVGTVGFRCARDGEM
ncbi:formylglycine-generating enzyme family protein [Chitinimonas sp.]|uniref:formylglycine-generating enzyme family protein n=1 Tax=Chitinimonas sp. TaxID=1934313 RepID=UPI0035B2D0C0